MKKIFTLGLFFSIVSAALAQGQSAKVVADKILAIVGDRIILYSDIQNTIADAIRNGNQVPDNANCVLMEQALISKVLMLQAEKDSLPITDDEVEADLDNRIRRYINVYGSQEALEEIAGRFRPDMVMISAGFDAHLTDPLGQLRLEDDDYISMTRTVKQWAAEACEGRIVSCLEGGYNLETLGHTVKNHVAELSR